MSSLQLGLAIAGALVLAGIVAHGAWQARRRTPRQPMMDQPPAAPEDGAVPDSRVEPTLDDLSAVAPTPTGESVRRVQLDPLIDSIATIELDAPVSGAAAIAALPSTRRAGSKPFAIEGLDVEAGLWEPPRPERRYSAFQAGVQLANRAGALNEIEFSEFAAKAQQFADAVGGALSLPEMLEEVGRARELDRFASAHDAQLGFTLRARSAAWSPGFIQQHAARFGFVAGAVPGRLVLPAPQPGLPPTLTLAFDPQAALSDDPHLSAVRQVVLSLDVPQVDRALQPYARMREIAVALTEVFDAVLTDDNGDPIPQQALDAIAQDLEQLYDALEARDLGAGSPQARRLFT
ncbi:FtsZ-interacting cell division protein ZipA [Tibeticola sediminis]|uniref:Cell division protein ZipA n=1 Tax=Tibeticola sediminis TaxID=1917811 RepID=A0A3N4VA56_9BURK|nr:cell division protein ZipA C-terminal FtsZ-binding domain-containing protein [Tibeticola sediminis]RPE70710.1 FtsZ-interacting cell division protein ZipA [Tibeticola sediminis]